MKTSNRCGATCCNTRAKVRGFALCAILLTHCFSANAQQSEKIRTIGFLSETKRSTNAEAFVLWLRKLGYLEGKNVSIVARYAMGDPGRIPEHAAELVRLKVDVILAPGTAVALAAKDATATIPIVFATVSDAVGSGLVASLSRPGAGALIVISSPMFLDEAKRIADLAKKHRLPTIYTVNEYVEAGGLMNYGVSVPDLFRRAAVYVDKILRGAKPADLPVEQPTKFDFMVNLKTAKQIGLTIPPNVLAKADRVIR
jgi:ABC-type uncharacterized transport system substrate-binding protein